MDVLSVSACVQAGMLTLYPETDLGLLIMLSSHKRVPRCSRSGTQDQGETRWVGWGRLREPPDQRSGDISRLRSSYRTATVPKRFQELRRDIRARG
jgi:hypothetical protein